MIRTTILQSEFAAPINAAPGHYVSVRVDVQRWTQDAADAALIAAAKSALAFGYTRRTTTGMPVWHHGYYTLAVWYAR
jgi:hypothetical protein